MGKELLCTAKMFLSSTQKLRYKGNPLKMPKGPKTAVSLLCGCPINAGPEKLGVTLPMLW